MNQDLNFEFEVEGIVLRTIPGYENYAINEDGTKIWSKERYESDGKGGERIRKAKWLSICESRHDYGKVTLCDGLTKKQYIIPILVARAWIGEAPFEGAWILHKDDDSKHNHYSNLYYGTRQDNARDMIKNGKKLYAEDLR